MSLRQSTVLLAAALILASSIDRIAFGIELNPQIQTGPQVERWRWDLKGSRGLAKTPAKAQAHYGAVPANLVRIPFFVNAHYSDGSVDQSQYATMLTSIANIKAINPNVEIFASLKLDAGDTFTGPATEPGWVAQGTPEWPADIGLMFSTPTRVHVRDCRFLGGLAEEWPRRRPGYSRTSRFP